MNGITIRVADSFDTPVLLRHRRLMWWDMGHREESALELMSEAATQYFAKALSEGSYRGFLAADAAGIVLGGGGVVISPWPGVLGQSQPRRAMIMNLYVEREYRRQGIALQLMNTMISWCRQNEFVSVSLHASDEGRALYERLRFKPTNEMSLDLQTSQDRA